MKLKVTVLSLASGLSCLALSPPPPPPFLSAVNTPQNSVKESLEPHSTPNVAQNPLVPPSPSVPSTSSELTAPASDPAASDASASTSPATDVPHGQDLVSIDFPNGVNLVDIVKTIGVWSGKNFLIAQGVLSTQKVSIIAPEPMTKEEAYQTFLSALNATGLTTVETGQIVKILSIANAKSTNIKTYYGATWAPETDEIINQVIPLRFIDANTVLNQLRGLLGLTQTAAFTTTNSLILTDTGFRIKSLLEIIQLLDSKKDQPQVEIIPINNMEAKEANQKIKDIFGGQGGSSINLNKSFVDERTNSLILVGPARGLDDIVKFIKRIDVPYIVETAAALIRVRQLEYADSEKLATTLSAFTSSQAKTGGQTPYIPPRFPSQPYFGGEQQQTQTTSQSLAADLSNAKVQSDKATNSLIIQATKAAYTEIENLIVALDKRRNQIYLEADMLALEMKSDFLWNPSALGASNVNGKRFFIPYGFNPIAASTLGLVQNGSSKDFQTVLQGIGNQFALGILSGSTVTIAGQKINPGALLFALKTDTNTNVLETPSMMVADNQTANFNSTQSYQSTIQVANPNGTGFTQMVQTYDVTTLLKVKPQIAQSGYVNMEITLKMDNAGPINAQGYPDPIYKRSADSILSVRSGQTAVMGGLTREEDQRKEYKIPLLGDIPILGWLFKQVVKNKVKSNLTLFITPYVVKNSADLAKIYEKKIKDRDEFLRIYYGKNYKKEDFYKILPTREQGKAIPETPVANTVDVTPSGVTAADPAVKSKDDKTKAHEELAGSRKQILPSQNHDPIIAPNQNSVVPQSAFSTPPPPPPPYFPQRNSNSNSNLNSNSSIRQLQSPSVSGIPQVTTPPPPPVVFTQ